MKVGLILTLNDAFCPECSEDTDKKMLDNDLPDGVFYCSNCKSLYIIKKLKVKLNMTKEIDEIFKEIGLGIDLLF